MTTATQYAIVGSGNIGAALAQLFQRAGLDVSITNSRGQQSLQDLSSSIGPRVHAVSLEEALKSEVIFMAIPFAAIDDFGRSVSDWSGKIVVDTTNAYYSPSAASMLQGRPAGNYVAEKLPGAQIVKAFNQLPANTLSTPLDPGQGKRVVFIASDVEEASEQVARIVTDLGLSPVQLGKIEDGGRLIEVPNALVLRNLIELPLH